MVTDDRTEQLLRELVDTLCIENREIKRSAALTRCVSETLSSLVRAGVEDSRELTRMALHVGRKFSKEFGPIDEGDNLSHYC